MSQLSINLSRYQDRSTGSVVAAGDNLSGTTRNLIAARTGYTIYLCRAVLAVTTDNAATQTIQDTSGTPVVFAKSKASPGLGPISWDYGEDGVPLTADKGLDIANSAAGLAGVWSITAYMRPTKDIAIVP